MTTGSLLLLSMVSTMSFTALTGNVETQSTPTPLTTLQEIIYDKQEEPKPTLTLVDIKEPPVSYNLREAPFISQTYNNCGPAAMSMLFSTYNLQVSQGELASIMRPYNTPLGGDDDKSVFPDEFVATAKDYGFESLYRPNGDINLLKQLVANDIPVVIRTWLNPGEDVGHYRIIRGYDDTSKVFIQDDSYQGKGLVYSYEDVVSMWKPFNYSYILVYPKEKKAVVEAILGEDIDRETAYRNALTRANSELKKDKNDFYAEFNRSTAFYHLGDTKNAVMSYDKAKDRLPDRILWYQYEPLYAYQKEERYDRVFQIAEGILNNGNRAYSELYQMRGEIYLDRGEVESARKEFELALRYNVNFEPAKKALEKI
ncbi:MAG: C39 family peptidase [Candidatus Levybacteria bacterium]|nr:C39 family peptidase [Candidatus Levybacteria bacterium]